MALQMRNFRNFLFYKAGYITRQMGIFRSFKYGQNKHRKPLFPSNPNKSGPLANLPDYSYLNGKTTPLGANQKKRILRQRDLAVKIVTLSKEMDFALDRYNRLQEKQQLDKRSIINNKLKPKGHLLLD